MEELFDSYDINGNYLVYKLKVFVIVGIRDVNENGQILVQRRASKKNFPNKYDMPSAGHDC